MRVSKCPSTWAGWYSPWGAPPRTPVHTIQRVPVTGIGDHLGFISGKDHKGRTLEGVGTEEKNDMKSTAHFCIHE